MRRCVVCGRPSVPIVCTPCCKEHGHTQKGIGIQYPIAVRGSWPEIGLGAVAARAFKESA